MSNFLALATVTAALERLLSPSVAADVAGAKVTLDRPDAKQTGPVVNVFLYHVVTNPVRTNDDLPGRRGDGSLAQRPRAAVDLRYLLTFHGNDLELEPQRLYGSVLRTLTARPLITPALVNDVVAAAGGNPARHPSLADSDLADAPEQVRLTPMPLDLEHLSRLWAVFPQTAYVLSSSWAASVVVVESEETPVGAAPVVESRLAVQPLRRPVVTVVEAATDPQAPLTGGIAWRIRGSQLLADRTVVRVAGLDLTPTSASSAEVVVEVGPAAALRAGRVAVEVAHVAMLGSPPTPHGDLASAVTIVTLAPTVASTSASAGTVTATVDIPVRPGQRVSLRLAHPDSGAVAEVLVVQPPDADTTTITAPVTVAPGSYAVIVTVDGADSPVQHDAGGAVSAPLVTVP